MLRLLSSTSTILDDGTAVTRLIANWNANSETDFSYYDLELQEASGSFISFPTSTNHYEIDVKAGVSYSAKLRAFDDMGNASGFSAPN